MVRFKIYINHGDTFLELNFHNSNNYPIGKFTYNKENFNIFRGWLKWEIRIKIQLI